MLKIQPSPARQGSPKRLRLPREINNNHFQSWDPTRSTQNGLRLSSSGYLENHRNKKPGGQFGHTQEKPWPHKRPEKLGFLLCLFSLPPLPACLLLEQAVYIYDSKRGNAIQCSFSPVWYSAHLPEIRMHYYCSNS